MTKVIEPNVGVNVPDFECTLETYFRPGVSEGGLIGQFAFILQMSVNTLRNNFDLTGNFMAPVLQLL